MADSGPVQHIWLVQYKKKKQICFIDKRVNILQQYLLSLFPKDPTEYFSAVAMYHIGYILLLDFISVMTVALFSSSSQRISTQEANWLRSQANRVM